MTKELPEAGWLIFKAGRGWYRPDAQGYTSSPLEAGRYTRQEALSRSHPNGLDGPRDGMSIKHESEVPGATAALSEPVAKVRVTNGGYAMTLATYVAYGLPEGDHWLYAHPPAPVGDYEGLIAKHELVARHDRMISVREFSAKTAIALRTLQAQLAEALKK